MVKLFILVHLPVAPYHYPFTKIGRYHKYFNVNLQKKMEQALSAQLATFLKLNPVFAKYEETVLLFSEYTIMLNTNIRTDSDARYKSAKTKWEYSWGDKRQDQAILLDLPENSGSAELTTLQCVLNTDADLNTFPFSALNKIALNHLQIDVLTQLEELKGELGNKNSLNKELVWFLQAEHIQWMSHNVNDFMYPSPFASSYDAYINFMNMLSDLKARF